MAKTNFQNGTIVSSAFLNSLYNTGGGHVHDGGADDGHADKIPIADVDGLSSEISGLDGRLDTAETDITNLETAVGNLQTDVASLENKLLYSGVHHDEQAISAGDTHLIQKCGYTLPPRTALYLRRISYEMTTLSTEIRPYINDGGTTWTGNSNRGTQDGLNILLHTNGSETTPTTSGFWLYAKNTHGSDSKNLDACAGWSVEVEIVDIV